MEEHIRSKIARFFYKYPQVHLEAGDTLIHAEYQPTHVYFLITGQVKQSDISKKGTELVLNVFHNPSFFPVTWALNRSHNIYAYTAVTAIDAHKAPIEDVLEWLKSEQDVMLDLLMRLQSGLEGVMRRLAYAMSGTAQEKLLLEIITSGERFGTKQGDGFSLEMSINELAARCGVARETASRELSILRQDNLLSTRSGIMTVPNKRLLIEMLA